MDVSIVIVSWNTRDVLRDCLRSVYEQAGNVGFEVIVVDNASTDGSAQMVKRSFPKAKLIANSTNRGFAAGNNQGIAIAKGRYVLLLNSDTIILDKAVAKTVAFADDNPEAAVVGCKILNSDRTLQQSCFMFPSLLNLLLAATYLYKLLPRSRFFGRERMSWWDRNDVREVDVVTGCFMLIRREAIEQVGPMDERFFMYGEETDFCYRFKKAGWKVMFTPAAEIIHLGGQSSKNVREDMLIQLRLSILEFMRKHYGWFNHKVASLLMALLLAVRLPVWFAVCIIPGELHNQGFGRVRAYLRTIGKIMASFFRRQGREQVI